MFGTLASVALNRGGTLEFIENPDPAAAINRRVQSKIRVACDFCRSRKARCSGGMKTCQRCEAMGLECVYSENQGNGERQENSQTRRAAIRRNRNSISNRAVIHESEPRVRSSQTEDRRDSALDDNLQCNIFDESMFDDNCIDGSLPSPWNIDTPLQNTLDSGSRSSGNQSSSEEFTSPSTRNSATVSSAQLLDSWMPDTSWTALPLPMDEMDTCKELQTVHGEMARVRVRVMASDEHEHDTLTSTSKPLCTAPRTGYDNCGCLLSSISFLERLTSKSASNESRMDRLLADVRSSMERLAEFMACELCAARVEQNMLLAMAARQLSIICKKTANCYKVLRLCSRGEIESSRQESDVEVAGLIDISVSTYRVSQREGQHLIESLVTFQLAELQQHINTIKARYRNQPNQGQAEAVMEAENNTKLAQAALRSHY